MKAIINVYSYILCFPIIVILNSCCDKETPVPDPCAISTFSSADFVIEESVQGEGKPRYFEVDTIKADFREIRFRAIQEAEEYEWKVGSDTTTYRSRSFTLMFTEPYGNIDIRLIIKRKPDLDCYPEDTGIDTVTKKLYVGVPSDAPIHGEYRGYKLSDSTNIFNVRINYSSGGLFTFGLYNLPNVCPRPISEGDWGSNAAYIHTGWSDCYNQIKAWAETKNSGTEIRIEYEYFLYENGDITTGRGSWYSDTYIGVKVD